MCVFGDFLFIYFFKFYCFHVSVVLGWGSVLLGYFVEVFVCWSVFWFFLHIYLSITVFHSRNADFSGLK